MIRLWTLLVTLLVAVPAYAQDKLVVSIWGGSWRDLVADTVAKKFTAETGVPVEFITGGTIDRLNKEKLAKGTPESDITFTTSHVDLQIECPGSSRDRLLVRSAGDQAVVRWPMGTAVGVSIQSGGCAAFPAE